MPLYRATVWHLSSTAAAVDGDAATTRRIIDMPADSVEDFKAKVRDLWLSDVDAEVTIGPVSLKEQ